MSPVEDVVPAEEEERAEEPAQEERAEEPAQEERAEEPAQEERAEEPAQEERVLFVIQRHPEGIRIVDIGNELGVDWRSLTRIVRSLMDERKIERIETMYYPREKAGEEEL